MIRIRQNIFETNSSSNDYYNDNWDDAYKHYTTAHQDVIIDLEFSDEATDDRIGFILNDIYNNCADDIDELFSDYYDDPCENIDINDDWVILTYEVTIPIGWEAGYPATRYSPGEDPLPVWDDDDIGGVPLKNERFPEKEKIKQQLMEIFKKHGYNEIIGVENIYADYINEEEAIENAYN